MMKRILDILKYNNIKLHPCSKDEILELEAKYDLKFPKTYFEFLEILGRGAGPYMEGSFCFYDTLDLIQVESKELLIQNQFQELPMGSFVFWMHQGYQFAFFILNQESDPAVYYYNETLKQNEFIKTYERISDFFYDEIINSGIEIPPALKK